MGSHNGFDNHSHITSMESHGKVGKSRPLRLVLLVGLQSRGLGPPRHLLGLRGPWTIFCFGVCQGPAPKTGCGPGLRKFSGIFRNSGKLIKHPGEKVTTFGGQKAVQGIPIWDGAPNSARRKLPHGAPRLALRLALVRPGRVDGHLAASFLAVFWCKVTGVSKQLATPKWLAETLGHLVQTNRI